MTRRAPTVRRVSDPRNTPAPDGAPDPTGVPVKPAATVMLIRDAGDGLEVFMLRRTLSAAFGSGMYVFPGGKVDAVDGTDVDRAHRLAAVRECFEEAGVLLAHDASSHPVTDGHPILARRHDVHDGTRELLELCAEHGLSIDLDQLAFVSHWITPVGEGRRFDTRFYVAAAPHGQTSVHDDSETIASLWARPDDALARQATGELTMMPPTIKNLQYLSGFRTVAEAMTASHALPTPPVILPRIRFAADGRILGVALPGDDDYEDLS